MRPTKDIDCTPTRIVDTPMPAKKEGGVWAFKNAYSREGPGGKIRVITTVWHFVKSGDELRF